MANILLLDACIRGEAHSRTFKLCQAFLEEYRALEPTDTIEHLCLAQENLAPLNHATFSKREALIDAGSFNDPTFAHARRFALADKIIIAAPYWELSFPSILRVYLEHVSVPGITYHMTELGYEGLCRAQSMMYITTAGGYVMDNDFGYEYARALFTLFGVYNSRSLFVEGLDIKGEKTEQKLQQGYERAKLMAGLF